MSSEEFLTLSRRASSAGAEAWYDKHSREIRCFAIAFIRVSYVCVLLIPKPQNIANAWKKNSNVSVD